MSQSQTPKVDEFDFPSRAINESPHAWWKALRDECPVHRPWRDRDVFLVSRWEDVTHVAEQPDVYLNNLAAVSEEFRRGTAAPYPNAPAGKYSPYATTHSDGADHRAKRAWSLKLVERARLDAYRPRVASLVDELIDGFADRGWCEFRGEFAELLPTYLVLDILGLPREDAGRCIEWVDTLVAGLDMGPTPDAKAKAIAAQRELYDYCEAAVLERYREPKDDFLSELVVDQVERDGGLDLNFQIVQAQNLIAAGAETTAHMLTNALVLLCHRPDAMRRVREDRALIHNLLDESMRLETPVSVLGRRAAVDTELRGVPIPAGSLVQLLWGAADRDERRFPNADELDLDRPRVAKDQLGFGRGRHRCAGAPLARLEGEIAFDRLLSRLDGIRLDTRRSDLRQIDSYIMHSWEKVVITFTAAT